MTLAHALPPCCTPGVGAVSWMWLLPGVTLPHDGRLPMRVRRAAKRSANHGWRVDHSCGSSSAATAVGWSATVGHRGDRPLRGDDQLARRAAPPVPPSRGRRRAARRRRRSGRRGRHGPPPRRRAPRRTTTAAIVTCGPAMRRNIHVCPPPGCRPSCMKRVSNLAAPGGDAHVAAEGEVHPGADGGAVDGGDRRQRAAGDAQEPLVDATEAVAVGLGQVAQVGPGTERRRRPGDDDGADRLVGLEGVHRRHDLVDHRRRQRVALVGVVRASAWRPRRRPR